MINKLIDYSENIGKEPLVIHVSTWLEENAICCSPRSFDWIVKRLKLSPEGWSYFCGDCGARVENCEHQDKEVKWKPTWKN